MKISTKNKEYEVIIIGLGRFGRRLSEMLDEHSGINYLSVDYDPVVINEWKAKGKDIIYGDMEDPDLLEQIPYNKDSIIISTVANNELSLHLKKITDGELFEGKVFVTAPTRNDVRQLQSYGFKEVNILRPHQMAAAQFYHAFLES